MGDLIGDIFGGGEKASQPIRDFKPVGINAGGLHGGFDGTSFKVRSTKERHDLAKNKSSIFSKYADRIGELLPMIRPGFGNLTNARVQAVRDTQRRTVGNLAETLQRRRVFGSSFAQDAISRTDAEFARQESEVRAQSFIEELALTNDLIAQQTTASINSVNSILERLNLEAEISTQLASQATSVLSNNAALQAQLNAQAQEGAGSFLGSLVGTGVKLYGISQGVPV